MTSMLSSKIPLVLSLRFRLIPVFSRYHFSQHLAGTSSNQSDLQSKTPNSPHSTTNQSNFIQTTTIGVHIETDTRDNNTHS